MKKLKIFLIGGLGNNLFQLSYGENLKNEGFDVQYNTFLKEKNIITTALRWSIHPSNELDSLLSNEVVSNKIDLVDLLYLFFVFIFKAVNAIDFQTSSKNKLFWGRGIGYWQKNITLNDELLRRAKKYIVHERALDFNGLESKNVLHVRRGDFQRTDQLSVEYYRSAMILLHEKKFTIVTDDKTMIDEFRDVFHSDFEFQLPDSRTLSQDLTIIANAKKLIMSNSTFCYWASQMGEVETVVYPSRLSRSKEWHLKLNNINQTMLEAIFNNESDKIN